MKGLFTHHLILAPILLPLVTSILLFFLEERYRQLKAHISIISATFLLLINFYLLINMFPAFSQAKTYALGSWPAPFGIVLVLDKLSALMVFLSSIIGLSALIFSRAYWYRTGHNFHAFMQFLFVGIHGAFLTGDLFNLFVFFEIMLTASYGLALHSFDEIRAKFGFHYVVVNLIASVFFLIGTALVYAVCGTLNFADLAVKIVHIESANFFLLGSGLCFLGMAFLIKIGMWPVSFWLIPLYSLVPAPIGCIFVLLSKVGFYVLLRLVSLLWYMQGSQFHHFGENIFFYGGIATLVYGFMQLLTHSDLRKLAACCVLCSSGIILSCLGLLSEKLMQGALYYMVSSCLALAAFFLLSELAERLKMPAEDLLAVRMATDYEEFEEAFEEEDLGKVLPNSFNILGLTYIFCAFLIVGLPPLSGFLGKFTVLYALFAADKGIGLTFISYKDWLLSIALLLSGFFTLIVLIEQGTRIFWTSLQEDTPKIYVIEFLPILFLLTLSLIMTLSAPLILHYLGELMGQLVNPINYIENVLKPITDKG